jgi:hypothetical protein
MGSLNLMVKATRPVLSIGDVYYCPNAIFTTHLRNGKIQIDTFDGAKPRFLNRGKKRRSVSTPAYRQAG